MIPKTNPHDDSLPWQSTAFQIAARYKELGLWNGMGVQYVEVDVGGRVLPHVRRRGELICVMEGEGTFLLEEETEKLQRGDCVYAPAGAVRGLVNNGDAPLRVLVIERHEEPPSLRSALSFLQGLQWLGKMRKG